MNLGLKIRIIKCAHLVPLLLSFVISSSAAFAQSPVSYQASTGETFKLFAYEGEKTALLLDNPNYNNAVITRMLRQMDYFWQVYIDATGRSPALYKHINSKSTLAVVDSDRLGGAAIGYVGATGVEFGKARFNEWHNNLITAPYDVDFLFAYEFGRNFYFYGGKLDARELNLGMQDASRVFSGSIYAPAIFKWWQKTNVNPDSYQWTETFYNYNEIAQVATNYILDGSASFQQVFKEAKYFPMTRNQQGNGFILQGLLFLLEEEYSEAFINAFWKEVAKLQNSQSGQDVIDNIAIASSRSAGSDLTWLFENQFKLPISQNAKTTVSSLAPRKQTLSLKRTLRTLANSNNLLLDPNATFRSNRSEWFLSNYLPPSMPKTSIYNPRTGSQAISLSGFNTASFGTGYNNLILRTVPIVQMQGKAGVYKLSGWLKATGLNITDLFTNTPALLSVMLYSNNQGNWNEFLPYRGVKGVHNPANFSFDWIYFETFGYRRPFDTSDEGTWVMLDVRILCQSGEVLVSDLKVEEFLDLMVRSSPTKVQELSDVRCIEGQPFTLSFGVACSEAVNYTWYKDGVVLNGINSPSYAVPSATKLDVGKYYCVASANNGEVKSRVADVAFSDGSVALPVIQTQPVAQTVNVGATVALSVSATGTPLPTFQWFKDDTAISAATSSTFSIPRASLADSGSYMVRVTNSGGSIFSSAAVIAVAATPTVNVAPTITYQPASQTVNAGSATSLSVTATGTPSPTYQWLKNGSAITGATASTLTFSVASAADTATYTVVVSNSVGSATSAAATLQVTPANLLSNLSVRAGINSGQTLIVGAIINGNGSKSVLTRASGPALSQFGIQGMADPRLELYTTGSTPVATNDDWSSSLAPVFTSVGAFGYQNGSRDAALNQLMSGSFTVQAKGTGPGTILVELYDVTGGTSSRLINISTRNRVGTGPDILIAGFVISGTGTKNLLIRAVGPGLAQFGLSGVLADPTLQVYDGNSVVVSNDNWSASLVSIFSSVGAFGLPNGSKDAATAVSLKAGGSYTVLISGADGGTGEALVEIYELP